MESNNHQLSLGHGSSPLTPPLGRGRVNVPIPKVTLVQTAASVREDAIALPEEVLRKPAKVVPVEAAPLPPDQVAHHAHVKTIMSLASQASETRTPEEAARLVPVIEAAGISLWEVALAMPKTPHCLRVFESLGVKPEVLQALWKAAPLQTMDGLVLRGQLRLQGITNVSLPISRADGGLILWGSSDIAFPCMTHCGGSIQAERTVRVRMPALQVAEGVIHATDSEGMCLDNLVRAKGLHACGAKSFFAPKLGEIEGNLWLGETDDAFFGNLRHIRGDVSIRGTNRMPIPMVEEIGGNVAFSIMAELASPMLKRIGGSLVSHYVNNLSLGALEHVEKGRWLRHSNLYAPLLQPAV